MSKILVAKNPDLSFLTTNIKNKESEKYNLPIILKKNGFFDWEANNYLTEYGGGSNVYNIKPIAKTVEKKAYNLNLFCQFMEDINILLPQVNDSTLYQYVEFLNKRKINEDTIISHIRTALDYIIHLNNVHPEWNLATNEVINSNDFNVHYILKSFNNGGVEKLYLHHRSLDGLIHISTEAELIHDDEYYKWLDAINVTTLHPQVDEFLIARWHALGTLLEITGSRISEIHLITRSMIKEASYGLLDIDKKHFIRDIPITKGKYKGKKRQVRVTKEDIQLVLRFVNIVEEKFSKINHDSIFVDTVSCNPLKLSYLKNYAKKVINNSPYSKDLRHLSNHSFRHRFITLQVAKEIKRLSNYGSFSNILSVAADACRKVTMHASNSTLSHYVHLATVINEQHSHENSSYEGLSSQVRIKIRKMLKISKSFYLKEIDESEALKNLLKEVNDFEKYNLKPT